MAEIDQETAMDLVRLLGKVDGFHARFDQLQASIKGLHERIDRHEEREEPRLQRIERMIWIGVGGVVILAGVIPFGLSAITKA